MNYAYECREFLIPTYYPHRFRLAWNIGQSQPRASSTLHHIWTNQSPSSLWTGSFQLSRWLCLLCICFPQNRGSGEIHPYFSSEWRLTLSLLLVQYAGRTSCCCLWYSQNKKFLAIWEASYNFVQMGGFSLEMMNLQIFAIWLVYILFFVVSLHLSATIVLVSWRHPDD